MSDSTTSILVTGAGGQLGSRLQTCAEGRPEVSLIGLGQDALDVCDRAAVFEAVATHRPDVVIHAAAYTAVDRAESEEPLAHEVNATAVRHVADACNEGGIPLIHISTDYVFGDVPRRPDKWLCIALYVGGVVFFFSCAPLASDPLTYGSIWHAL